MRYPVKANAILFSRIWLTDQPVSFVFACGTRQQGIGSANIREPPSSYAHSIIGYKLPGKEFVNIAK